MITQLFTIRVHESSFDQRFLVIRNWFVIFTRNVLIPTTNMFLTLLTHFYPIFSSFFCKKKKNQTNKKLTFQTGIHIYTHPKTRRLALCKTNIFSPTNKRQNKNTSIPEREKEKKKTTNKVLRVQTRKIFRTKYPKSSITLYEQRAILFLNDNLLAWLYIII